LDEYLLYRLWPDLSTATILEELPVLALWSKRFYRAGVGGGRDVVREERHEGGQTVSVTEEEVESQELYRCTPLHSGPIFRCGGGFGISRQDGAKPSGP
jgi:hypothetical protein